MSTPPASRRSSRPATRRRLLALALASALAVPAWAQSIEPFTASDIRVDGLQRISAGTVSSCVNSRRSASLLLPGTTRVAPFSSVKSVIAQIVLHCTS